ncbi:MAG: histidine triad nucleotide-binding protein [Oscillospiraceae bacterium]|nr:histidine triad nucleotide-binding protein [Oscillospiraceae bacterium]
MDNCIFCKIISGEIPSQKLYEDDKILAFRDTSPQAPVHFLVVPKEHISGADDITAENCAAIGYIFAKIPQIMRGQGITNGYRIVNNCGEDGGQSVAHIHFHCLAGRGLGWPPG